jgi:hypothetical protein
VFLWFVFYENSDQVMHSFVFFLLFVFVYIELFSKQTVPVFLQFCFCGLSDDLTFHLNRTFIVDTVKAFKFLGSFTTQKTCWALNFTSIARSGLGPSSDRVGQSD